jgi:hypothetical protein
VPDAGRDETPSGLARALSDAAVRVAWGLLVVTLAVQLVLDRVGWTLYTLAHDLPWVGVALGSVALLATAAGRRSARAGRLAARLVGARRGWRRAGAAWLVVAGVAAAAPLAVPSSERGLSVSIEPAPGASSEPDRLVAGLDLGPGDGEPWIRPRVVATLHGWLYAPVNGRYTFAVEADDRAVLGIDGASWGEASEGHGRRARLHLGQGFHRLRVAFANEAGPSHLSVRWAPPFGARWRDVPSLYLVPDGVSPGTLRARQAVLALHQLGVLVLAVGLAVLGAARLVPAARGIPPGAAASWRVHVGVVLLFFLLTETSVLYPHERLVGLRQVLLVLLVLGAAGLWLVDPARRPAIPRLPRPAPWVRSTLALGGLAVIQAALTLRFVTSLQGQLVFSEDHASFLYRFHLLLQTLPRFMGYDPFWNAGAVDNTAIGGGAAGVLLVMWPLVRLLGLDRAYAFFVPAVGLWAAPWGLFAATRLLGYPRLAAFIAALLALAPDEQLFVWLLQRGTLPAVFSAALVPLAFVLAWRVFFLRDRRLVPIAALLVVANLGSFWILFPVMVLPALVAGLFTRRRPGWADAGLALLLAAGLVAANASWILEFLSTRSVGAILQSRSGGFPAFTLGYRLTEAVPATLGPIGLVGGSAGLFLLPRSVRLPYAALLGWLATVAIAGPGLFPRLELLRWTIPMGYALALPAAVLLRRGCRLLRSGPAAGVPGLIALGLVVVLGTHLWEVSARFANATPRRVGVMPPLTREVVDWLHRHTRPDARILLAGRVVHQYGGFAAYLQPLVGRPMIANSYYFGQWSEIPWLDEALEDPMALRRRLELLNVRYLVADATDSRWWTRLPTIPWLTRRAEWQPSFAVYETDILPTYLIGGAGEVDVAYNRIRVRLDAPGPAGSEVLLKFRWVRGLAVSPPMPLDAAEVLPHFWYIRVQPGSAREFEIRY